MPRNIDWRHFVAFGGILVSATLPYLLFPREEYEYVEVIEEPDLTPDEEAVTDPEPKKEPADDQQED